MIHDWKDIVRALSLGWRVPFAAIDVAGVLNASDAGRWSEMRLRAWAGISWVYRAELARREALEDE